MNYTCCIGYQPSCNSITPASTRLMLPQNFYRILSRRYRCAFASPHGFSKHYIPLHRHLTSIRLFPPISISMRRWTVVAIPVSMVLSPPLPETQSQLTPNTFVKCCDTNASLAQHQIPGSGDDIITNPLDEEQQLSIQQEESALLRTRLAATLKIHRVYLFTSSV